MRNASKLITFVTLCFFLAACGGAQDGKGHRSSYDGIESAIRSHCDLIKDAEERSECFREDNARLTGLTAKLIDHQRQEPKPEAVPAAVPSSPSPAVAELPTARNRYGILYVPTDANGECGQPGYNYGVPNGQPIHAIELEPETHNGLPALVPCGDGFVTALIRQGNGELRFAVVIPPMGRGKYVFLSDHGGHGQQSVKVHRYGYNPASVPDPRSPFPILLRALRPSRYAGTHVASPRTPFTDVWGYLKITPHTRFSEPAS